MEEKSRDYAPHPSAYDALANVFILPSNGSRTAVGCLHDEASSTSWLNVELASSCKRGLSHESDFTFSITNTTQTLCSALLATVNDFCAPIINSMSTT